MNEKVAAPVETLPDKAEVSAAVWLSLAAPNWKASPPAVPYITPCSINIFLVLIWKILWKETMRL